MFVKKIVNDKHEFFMFGLFCVATDKFTDLKSITQKILNDCKLWNVIRYASSKVSKSVPIFLKTNQNIDD